MTEEVYQIVVDSEVGLEDPNLSSISNLPNVPFTIQSSQGSLQLQVQDGECQMELCGSSGETFTFRGPERHIFKTSEGPVQYENGETHLLVNENQPSGNQLLESDQQDSIQIPQEVRSLQIQTESGDSMEIVPIHTTKEDGSEEITYIQVGPPSVLAPENLDRMLSLFLEYGPSWKNDLLLDIQTSSYGFFTFPVFCKDGIFWTNKLLLASVSKMVGEALEQSDVDSCLVIPDLCKNDLETFFNTTLESNIMNQNTNCVRRVANLLSVDGLCEPFHDLEDDYVQANGIEYASIIQKNDKAKLAKYMGHFCDNIEKNMKEISNNYQIPAVKLFKDFSHSCQFCYRKFSDNAHLQRHVGLVHTSKNISADSVSQNYECQICDEKFKFAASVKKHVWLVHKETRNKNVDKAKENNIQKTQEKKSAVLKEKLEDIKCRICGKYFPNWKKLQLHMLDHTTDRPFKCDECGKGFKEETKLKRHMIIHTGEKPFKCNYCSKAFSLKQNKEIHERLHTGEGFGCSYCGEVFSQKVNLKKHEIKHIRLRHLVTDSPEIRLKQSGVSTKSKFKIGSPTKNNGRNLAPKLLILEDENDSSQKFVVDNSPQIVLLSNGNMPNNIMTL